MKQSINFNQFCDTFRSMGRENQFSYEAQQLIFDYLEECNPDYELDVIAICCEYSEDSAAQIADLYGLEFSSIKEGDTDGERDHVLAYLNDHTSVVGVTPSGSIVYAQF